MRLWLEIEGEGALPILPGEGAALCAFCSFAVSRGFGATHPLIALADRLHDQHRVRMGPLTTFYDSEVEDAEDSEKLELAWQDAAELKEAAEQMITALDSDEQARTLARRGGAEELQEQAGALVAQLGQAVERARRVRLVYAL
ncbi:MAG: hypothetical protein C0506_04815 [Anaerolinea sp.]|nr:hypothetical protein [Anaerolinea sp.]